MLVIERLFYKYRPRPGTCTMFEQSDQILFVVYLHPTIPTYSFQFQLAQVCYTNSARKKVIMCKILDWNMFLSFGQNGRTTGLFQAMHM